MKELADKMGAADRRAQKRHVADRFLSIEAAESYLEAGRLSQTLKQGCSRGEFRKARRRAGLTAKRAKKLRRLAADWHEPGHLYERFNRTWTFRTEDEARRFRADMAREGVDVLIETADAWAARTRGEVERTGGVFFDAWEKATWFATFYTGEDGLLAIESMAALVEALRKVDNEAAESAGADTIETRMAGTQGGLTGVERNVAYLQRRNGAMSSVHTQYLRLYMQGKADAGRSP